MNPTVTNLGLAFALSAGFTDIYLLGTDLGSKEQKIHHAKSSVYYNPEGILAEYAVPQYSIKRKGNFANEIWTNDDLNSSRNAMVLAIAELSASNQKFIT